MDRGGAVTPACRAHWLGSIPSLPTAADAVRTTSHLVTVVPSGSRFNVYARDGFRCQYCGQRSALRELTYDHVVPRCRGGRTVWDNIVTACRPCNNKKGRKTCDEAGMFPLREPIKPRTLPTVSPVIDVERALAEWHDFLRPFSPIAD